MECIVITQAHDAHTCKVKTFETNFVARHVKYKKKKTICQFEGMKLDHRNYLDLNEKTCLQGFRPCKTQTNDSVTEISQNAEILRIASLSIILY